VTYSDILTTWKQWQKFPYGVGSGILSSSVWSLRDDGLCNIPLLCLAVNDMQKASYTVNESDESSATLWIRNNIHRHQLTIWKWSQKLFMVLGCVSSRYNASTMQRLTRGCSSFSKCPHKNTISSVMKMYLILKQLFINIADCALAYIQDVWKSVLQIWKLI
jgi:hypothetical protein